MDFAIVIGDSRTVVYKKNDGIVLNESTTVAFKKSSKHEVEIIKPIAIGNAAKKMQDKVGDEITVESPVFGGRIANLQLAQIYFNEIFRRVSGPIKRSCLFCIPCSLTPDELNDYKNIAYAVGLADAAFVPSVVTSALGLGFNVGSSSACLSINITEAGTDIAVISLGGILHGGSVDEGGRLATRAVRDFIQRKSNTYISERMAAQAKAETATLLLKSEAEFDGFTGEDCEKILRPIYTRVSSAAKQILSTCNPDVLKDIRTGQIFIGGEDSSVEGLREFFAREFGVQVVTAADGINSAINGAGKLLSDKSLLQKVIKAN